jgi:hypothetical protein
MASSLQAAGHIVSYGSVWTSVSRYVHFCIAAAHHWLPRLYLSQSLPLPPKSFSFFLSATSSTIVPCICRRPGQCGWRRPSCGRWRRARRYCHIRCAGPVASVSAAWEGRHRRRQGASQAWPASCRDATGLGGGRRRRNSSQAGSSLRRIDGNFRLSCASCSRREGARIRSIGRRVARVVGEASLSEQYELAMPLA